MYSLDVAHYEPRCRGCRRRSGWARRSGGRWRAVDPATVLEQYRGGLGVKTIARLYGHSPAAVRAALVEQGEPIRARSAPFAPRRTR